MLPVGLFLQGEEFVTSMLPLKKKKRPRKEERCDKGHTRLCVVRGQNAYGQLQTEWTEKW